MGTSATMFAVMPDKSVLRAGEDTDLLDLVFASRSPIQTEISLATTLFRGFLDDERRVFSLVLQGRSLARIITLLRLEEVGVRELLSSVLAKLGEQAVPALNDAAQKVRQILEQQ
jgi:hypothetical protein